MNIEWDYSYYQPWSDNEWLVNEMIAMREEMLMVQNRHYYAVMHRMSKHPRRQWTHGVDRTLQRNLGLFFFSIFGLVLNGTTSD